MVIISCFVLALLIGGWLLLYRMHGKEYESFKTVRVEGLRLQKMAPPFLHLLYKFRIFQKFPLLMFRLQRSVQKLYGIRSSQEKTMLFLAEMAGYFFLLLGGGCMLTLAMGGDASGLMLGLGLGILLPAALVKDLHAKVSKRDQEMIMELPELLGKIMLLVGAGETVQRAIIHCTERKKHQADHPLYRELTQTIAEWEGGYSFQQAFEQLSRRCGIQEVTVFTTAVLLNMRRGGSDFVMALGELSQSLWNKRTAISRTLGEQASSKLVFPMAVILLTVIVLVGAPAFMMMNM
ncbi:type II secretion system F family protein [Paenibacillus jiagnxiensis]|uniref:type II secretion system F family protein n=1 Tax=Paenibacillus jiagnxiensis TaxID=3228926 RepID=UPI0033A4769E